MTDSEDTIRAVGGSGDRASTGIPGLDDILVGGLTRQRLYLVEGLPGSGKTTLGLQFLLEGQRRGERCMFVTLSETEDELRASAASHGWSLDAISVVELSTFRGEEEEQTLLHPAEFELGRTTGRILERIKQEKPDRIVIDNLSEVRMLAQTPLRYRWQFFALRRLFTSLGCVVLLLDDKTARPDDLQIQTLVHGVISLERGSLNTYGAERLVLNVVKMRGIAFHRGAHDYAILTGGLVVYPRVTIFQNILKTESITVSTGVAELDSLLGGGLVTGASTLIMGPTGTGKTSTATRCVLTALERGESAAAFIFDEQRSALRARSAELGMDLSPYLESGRLRLHEFDASELSPGKFSHDIRSAVDVDGARMILIDSLNGYYHAMPNEQYLMLQLHDLLGFLSRSGVVTLLVLGQHGLTGAVHSQIDLSYLCDTLLLTRYFEAAGQVRRCLSIVKTRTAKHESTIREFTLGPPDCLTIGPVLHDFENVLAGAPVFRGAAHTLMDTPPGSDTDTPV
ncbi:ATPase domain-containing protein [Methylocystis sp.]|uniref:ATPase domain-containing protein n=1 Tax=Methylocystis sp. TaxID=1911079 RepID=UPI003DA1F139